MTSADTSVDEAAAWFARLRADDCTAADRANLGRWLAQDPAHRLAYADVCAAALAVEQLQAGAQPAATAPLVSQRMLFGPARWWASVAVVLLFALGIAIPASWTALYADHRTGTGEIRMLTLEDGSQVVLGADSAIAVTLGSDSRVVELLAGEVSVAVQPDPTRPFRIRAGAVTATALGTEYRARLDPGGVVVDVAHGKVAVSIGGHAGTAIGAGERLRVSGSRPGMVLEVPMRDSGMRDGMLAFADEPLAAVLATLDRHVDERVWLLADSAAESPVTAAIPASAARQSLATLADQHGLRLRSVPGVAILLY